jgi:hypothetical protein
MALAILICWFTTLVFCLNSERLETVLFNGGLAVAICQVAPILQFGCGMLAMWAWETIAGDVRPNSDGFSGFLAGFAVTLLTAQPLLFAAWFLGGGIRMLHSSDAVPKEDAADYSEPASAQTVSALTDPKT